MTVHALPARFPHSFSRVVVVLGALVALNGCADGSAGPTAGPPQIGLAGNEEVLWLLLRESGPDNEPLLRLAFRSVSPDTLGRFVDLPIPPLQGRIAMAAARRSDLHVFFAEGAHRRFTPGSAFFGDALSQMQFIERSLPHGQPSIAVAVDPAQHRLYALVAQVTADPQNDATGAPWPATGPGHPGARPRPTVPTNSSAFAILYYTGAMWLPDRDAPDGLDSGAVVEVMLVANEVVHLVYRAHSDGGAFTHRISAGPAEPWRPGPAPPIGPGTVVDGGWAADEPVLLLSRAAPDGVFLHTLRFDGGLWVDGATVADRTGRPVLFDRAAVMSFCGGEIAAASPAEAGKLEVGFWSTATGRPTAAAVRHVGRREPPQPGLQPLIHYAVLCGILAIVFVWRRDSLTRHAALPPGLSLAQLSKRALALLIDLAILLPVWGSLLFALWRRDAPELTVTQQLAISPRMAAPSLYWAKAMIGGVFGLYAAVLESWTGTTAGKRWTGLAVSEPQGQPCRVTVIIVRNLARLVEFHFPPLVLLVAFTPSRQRLGDLLAGSVVVEIADRGALAEAGGDDQDEDGPEGA